MSEALELELKALLLEIKEDLWSLSEDLKGSWKQDVVVNLAVKIERTLEKHHESY